ncbi:amino acid ABC transporter permease [Knoellia sp. CPCC 206453]|uniref:amino acid ABC transporter permease n=1 Tax=Knoellia pratensis TaxID=3404796 RepID=UPI00360A5F46
MSAHELSFLYDPPTTRSRRRGRVATTIVVVAITGLVVAAAAQLASRGQLDAARWTPLLDPQILSYLGVGLRGTLLATAVVAVAAFPLGVALAVGKVDRRPFVRRTCAVFIEVFRTIPVLLLIYVMLFALPRYGINPDLLWKLTIPLTIANSAAIAEIVRAGIVSLPRGQSEAGLSLGMPHRTVMSAIVLPQALRAVTPSLVSQLASLLKDTSLGFVVAFTELLYRAQVLTSFNRLLIQTYVVVTLVYLVVCGLLTALASRLRGRPTRTPGGHTTDALPMAPGPRPERSPSDPPTGQRDPW